MKKLLTLTLAALSLSFGLTACNNGKKTIYIGTMAQPGEPILKYIEKEFEEKSGYNMEIQIYTDFATPNNALAAKEIQANLFQHQPYLDTYNTANNTDLQCACIMYDCAYGGYSKKVTSLTDIPDGKKITIANDASNMKRCLDILAVEGLIVVDYGETAASDLNPNNINDYISSNPHNYNISPISTSLIAASLDDSDTYLGIVNATFAIAAGLGSNASLLCQESDPTHKNANIVAVAKNNLEADWCKTLVEILTSSDTDAFVSQTFGSTITPYHGN